MSDAARPVEFATRFRNVRFSAVPDDMRVDPDALSPEIRPAYDRIAAAGGAAFVSMTKDGGLRLCGTFTQIRKDGTAHPGQAFVAFTSKTRGGRVLDFAGDMLAKFSDPSAVGFAKARVVLGSEKSWRYGLARDLDVSFPETEAERRARFVASAGASETRRSGDEGSR